MLNISGKPVNWVGVCVVYHPVAENREGLDGSLRREYDLFWRWQLRSLSLAAIFLAVMPFALGNIDSPFLRITVMGKESNLVVTGKNISRSPIVAYVVFAELRHSRVVWKSVFSVGESLKPGKNVELGNVPLGLTSERVNFFVDYVRLADGTEWGDSTTEEAKELSARYQK